MRLCGPFIAIWPPDGALRKGEMAAPPGYGRRATGKSALSQTMSATKKAGGREPHRPYFFLPVDIMA